MLLGIFNAACALTFGLLLVHHDFTYSFSTKTDKLARKKSVASKIIVLSDIWLSFLNNSLITFTI